MSISNQQSAHVDVSVDAKNWSSEFISRAEDKSMVEAIDLIGVHTSAVEALIEDKFNFYDNLQMKTADAYKRAIHNAAKGILSQHPLQELTAFPFDIPEATINAMTYQLSVSTLADVYQFPAEHFEVIRGVGPAKAKQLAKAISDYATVLSSKAHIDLKKSTEDQTVFYLLRHLYLNRFYGQFPQDLPTTENMMHFIRTLEQTNLDLEGFTSFGSIFFPRNEDRTNTRTVLAGLLNEWVALNPADVVADEEDIKAGREHHMQVSAQTVYDDFLNTPSTYYAILSRFAPEMVQPQKSSALAGQAFAGGAIGEQLWESIKATELDLSLMKNTLRPYQEFAVKFAVHQKRMLLGDDMGLGKTISSIAVMSHVTAQTEEHITHLVVAPKSVQENWSRELKLHSQLTSIMVEDKRQKINPADYDVIITTYERINTSLASLVSGAVIVDEAHLVKNPEAQRTQRVLSALEGKEHAMFLTGTAIENNLEELTNLVSFVAPGLMSELAKLSDAPTPDAYRDVISTAYLRRNKEDVLTELPELTVKDEWVQMGSAEESFYADALGSDWHAVRKAGYRQVGFSKITRMREIVENAQKTGEKVLIFSFYLEILDTVAAAFPNLPQVRVDGSVDASERQKLVDEFGAVNGTSLFISQISTGGVGLNLQSASRVILCEPQIKFSLETQAIARAHRMGQLNPVIAHRLATVDTLDERIVGLRNVKENLFDEYARNTDLGDKSVDLEDEGKVKKQLLADERAKHGVSTTTTKTVAASAPAAPANDDDEFTF